MKRFCLTERLILTLRIQTQAEGLPSLMGVRDSGSGESHFVVSTTG